MFTLSIKSRELLGLAARARHGLPGPLMERALNRATIATAQASRRKHPGWESWTGNLRASIFPEAARAGGGAYSSAVFIDDARAPYGGFLYYGTRAHGPVTAPYLVFKTRDGRTIRTKWVRGITADPWIEHIAEADNGPFVTTLERGVDYALGSVFK